jgi:hypothetical protein
MMKEVLMVLVTRSLSRLTLMVLAALVLAMAPARAQAAGVPSPANSTVPACLISAPNGFASTMIVVRDLANNPVSSSFVVIQYALCTEFNPCPALVTDDYVLDLPGQSMRRFTNAQGQAEFHVRAGGGCSGDNIRVFADGVLLANIRSASVDQNGDHSVDAADIALHETRQGTLDYRGDLNCDWMVNEDDEFIIGGALGTNCLDPTPSRRSTWGQVKIRYR